MKSTTRLSAVVIVFYITIFIGISYLLALWTDRNLDFWMSYFKGTPVNVPFWLSCLLSLVLNAIAFAANVIAEIARFFV